MAVSTALIELEENFFLCPSCLEQLTEPKLLACLHRYCSTCLGKLVNGSKDGSIKCPMCNEQFAIPDDGIEGFKTDFHMKSVVEFLQLKTSLENKYLQKCLSCSTKKIVSTYCFKCNGFLCEQCYDIHITSKIFTHHKSSTHKLENIEGRNMKLEKLEALTENKRCRTHVEENAKLCCSTCKNEPVCGICAYTKHKGHDLNDVTELAKTERGLLEVKVTELQALRSKFYELPKGVEVTKQKLNENVSMKTNKLINQHKHQVNKVKDKLEKRRNEKVQRLADIEKRRKDEEWQTHLKYEDDINKLNESYEEIRKSTERKYNNEKQHLIDSCEKAERELLSKLESLDVYLKSLTESTELLKGNNKKELTKISHNCNQLIEKYETFTSTISSIFEANDEWTQVQFIPDVRAAWEHLAQEMKNEYPKLEFLSDIFCVNDLPNILIENITLSGQEQSVVDINRLNTVDWTIHGMTLNRNGDIVISGRVSNEYSHITSINRKGEIKRQDQIKEVKESSVFPDRYCCYLSEFKVATVCKPDEIGIYDVRDGSYYRKYISNYNCNFPANGIVYCLGNDPFKNHILVGTNSRYLYVFDYQVNHIHTITLPDIISAVNDITVHKNSLVVCDLVGKRAYAVTVDENIGKLMYEFTEPPFDGSNVGPLRVCTDKNDFIYMLWRETVSNRWKCNLTHYSQDGRQILATIKVDDNAISLAVLEVRESEKLLIATMTSGKMFEYNIEVT